MDNPLLVGMKERLERARERLQRSQTAFQAVQAEHASATAEFNVWNSAITLLLREEEKRLAESKEKQMNLPDLQTPPPVPVVVSREPEAVNKTEKVREVLRQVPNGASASGIWNEVKDYISSRAYLYSILKRLRDNEEVSLRRGKYVLRPKLVQQEASGNEHVVVQ